MLVDQPGSGAAVRAGLGGGDLSGLQGRSHHHQSMPLERQQLMNRPQGGGLTGARGTFDHDE